MLPSGIGWFLSDVARGRCAKGWQACDDTRATLYLRSTVVADVFGVRLQVLHVNQLLARVARAMISAARSMLVMLPPC